MSIHPSVLSSLSILSLLGEEWGPHCLSSHVLVDGEEPKSDNLGKIFGETPVLRTVLRTLLKT